MRIENGGNPIRPHHRPEQSKATTTRVDSHASNGGGALTSVDLKSMESLLSLVANTSEVRESVVADIKLKVQNGEYLAKQAALDTADAILNL